MKGSARKKAAEEEEGGTTMPLAAADNENDDQDDDEAAPPKLAEGFYEIEDIRRKRKRKGQIQYLIKWRGWPETANTWEPYENIQCCPEIIEAFERRLRSPRKRKRKSRQTGPHHPLPSNSNSRNKRTTTTPSDNTQTATTPPPPQGVEEEEDDDDADEEEGDSDMPLVQANSAATTAAADNATNSPDKHAHHEQAKDANDMIHGNLSSLQQDQKNDNHEIPHRAHLDRDACEEETNNNAVSNMPEDEHLGGGSIDGAPKNDCPQRVEGNRMAGAKRRKPSYVKRFKLDSSPCHKDAAFARDKKGSLPLGERSGNEVVDSNEIGVVDKNKLDDLACRPYIVKILKTIELCATVTNNVQGVSTKFMALRSDGKEVVIDNNYLKLSNPLLLIDYYEQHLRCGPPGE